MKWNRIESLEIDPPKYSQLIINKESKEIWWRKKQSFQQLTERSGLTHGEKKNLDIDFTHFIKVNSKWIIDLNMQHETIRLLEGNVEENLVDFKQMSFQIKHEKHNL